MTRRGTGSLTLVLFLVLIPLLHGVVGRLGSGRGKLPQALVPVRKADAAEGGTGTRDLYADAAERERALRYNRTREWLVLASLA